MWIYDTPPEVAAKSNWRVIVGLTLASTIMMVLICGLRFWIKRRHLGSEDWMIVVAVACNLVFATFAIIQTRYGLGLPVPLRPKSMHHWYLVYNYAGRGPNIVAVALSKIALCVSCLKMIRGTNFWRYRWFIVSLAIFTGSFWLALCLIEVFNCRPFMKAIYPEMPGYCIPYAPPTISIWSLNIFDDILVYLLPVPLIVRLQLERAVKISLIVSFAMGLFTTVFSILKISQVPRIVHGDHNSSLLVLFTALEGNVGAMSASWPILRSFVAHLPKAVASHFTAGSTSRQKHSISYELGSARTTTARKSHDPMQDQTMETASKDTKTTPDIYDDGESDEVALVDGPWDERGIVKTVDYRVESSSPALGMQQQNQRGYSWAGPRQ